MRTVVRQFRRPLLRRILRIRCDRRMMMTTTMMMTTVVTTVAVMREGMREAATATKGIVVMKEA